MNFVTITIAGEDYKLSLTTSAIIQIERKLGKSALTDIMKLSSGDPSTMETPKLEDLLIMLHGCMQRFNANTSLEKVYQLYDVMVEDGEAYKNGPYMEVLGKVSEAITAVFFGRKNK